MFIHKFIIQKQTSLVLCFQRRRYCLLITSVQLQSKLKTIKIKVGTNEFFVNAVEAKLPAAMITFTIYNGNDNILSSMCREQMYHRDEISYRSQNIEKEDVEKKYIIIGGFYDSDNKLLS